MTKRNRNIKNICIKLQMGTNIMANQVRTPIQNYFVKVLYENLTFEIPPLWFLYARLETGRIIWLGMAGGRTGVLTGFRALTLVLYIGSLPNLATWFPCRSGRTLSILRSLGQRSRSLVCYYKYNFWQQGCFRAITLVLYIGSLTNLATWFPCGRGRTIYFGVIRSKVKVISLLL